ncbi:MAG: DUF2608 domain-containing protein [Pseudomonadota bacterium]
MFLKASRIIDIKQVIESLPKDSIIFIDVDDTIITPVSSSFRVRVGELNLIDEIKLNKESYPNYKEIISNWRLSRKTILTDPDWPEFIKELKNYFKVFALTKMDKGKFGNIKSMEEWRYNELKSFDIEFTELNDYNAYQGIFMTGDIKKSEIIQDYISYLKPAHILFIDDIDKYLKDMSGYCSEQSIPFTGIHYHGTENITGSVSEEIKNIQKHHLINNLIWLEDDQALKYISSNN